MAENKMMLKGLFMFWSQREKFYAAKQRHSPIRKNNDDFASNNNWIEGRIGLLKYPSDVCRKSKLTNNIIITPEYNL